MHIASDMKCTVALANGTVEEFDGWDRRFHHPYVKGAFPSVDFIFYLSTKNPDIFHETGVSSGRREYQLDGSDPNVIRLPFGPLQNPGVLSLAVEKERLPIKTITLLFNSEHKFETLSPDQGRHYRYATPGDRGNELALLSQFESQIFGIPANIDFLAAGQGPAKTTAKFPTGHELPGSTMNTKLTDLSKVDFASLHGMPVTIKIFYGKPIDGIIHTYKNSELDGESLRKMEKHYFMFLDFDTIEMIQEGRRSDSDLVKFMTEKVFHVAKDSVEYIDIRPTILAGQYGWKSRIGL